MTTGQTNASNSAARTSAGGANKRKRAAATADRLDDAGADSARYRRTKTTNRAVHLCPHGARQLKARHRRQV